LQTLPEPLIISIIEICWSQVVVTVIFLLRLFDLLSLFIVFFFQMALNILQECESSLKHKTELIAKLESKSYAMTDTLQKMEEKYVP